jgi:hypothetical protein
MEQLKQLYNKTDLLLITAASLIGLMSLFIPIWWIGFLILAVTIFILSIINPKYIFYGLIFTIPFTERIRSLPISFSPNDIVVLWCFVAVFLNIFFRNKKVDLKTHIDKWNIILLILYFAAGIYSIYDRGLLTSFKFLGVITVYYMTIYFIRTKQVKITSIIKFFIFAGVFQAIIGILQSTTGLFGPTFLSNRGLLGYLGIGPTLVWHAWGTFGSNGSLGIFLLNIIFFILPFHRSLTKKTKYIIFSIFFVAIYMVYLKSIFVIFFINILFYMIYKAANVKTAVLKVSVAIAVIAVMVVIAMSTPFAETVNQSVQCRLQLWQYPLTAFAEKPQVLLFGTGLTSYFEFVGPYIPEYVVSGDKEALGWMLVHNDYILIVQQMGFVGFFLVFSFLFSLLKILSSYYFKSNSMTSNLYLSSILTVFPIFVVCFIGQCFTVPYIMTFVFIFLGISFSKIKSTKSSG